MFQYYGGQPQGNQGLQGLQYPSFQQPGQSEQQQGVGPGSLMQIGKQFMGGGSGATAGAAGAESAGGAGGGSAGGVGAGGLWAALAAVIVGNEWYASSHGDRSEDKWQHAQDMLSGEVLGQDIEKRWLPHLGIEEGSGKSKWISTLLHPASADLGKTWEQIKDLF